MGYYFLLKIIIIKKKNNNKQTRLSPAVRGNLAEMLPSACPRRVGFLAGICWKNIVKGPLISREWGGVVTID